MDTQNKLFLGYYKEKKLNKLDMIKNEQNNCSNKSNNVSIFLKNYERYDLILNYLLD